uniref:Uncharacterized protein n=1 Tax=Utricularia reniformis TaxID=192314 RepID=A0A1Y0B4U0_9LAMI|nr:hypothetical protein AEK19_MT2260 [Utricularia reniformis]ART32404.1 hypothetical protein AEK19_MT2260 [Utricularia reniformis]
MEDIRSKRPLFFTLSSQSRLNCMPPLYLAKTFWKLRLKTNSFATNTAHMSCPISA